MSKLNFNFNKVGTQNWGKLFFELIVVFLGVTAGFLLNNWQLQRQDSSLEKKYLGGFLQDAEANINDLSEAVKLDSLWLFAARPKLIEIQKGTLNTDSANHLIKQIVRISKVDFHSGTYEDIINSGNLNILSNYNLKKQIVEYNVTISGVKFIDDYFYRYFSDFVMPFLFSSYNVLAEKLVSPEIIKTVQFSNVISGYYSMVQQRKSGYERLLKKSISLRDELKRMDLNFD